MDSHFEVDLNDYSFLEQAREAGRGIMRPIEVADRLKGLYWIEFECSRLAMGWVSAFPDWEVKGRLVRQAYLHTEHMKLLEARIDELPGRGVGGKSWTPQNVGEAFQRMSIAYSTEAFAAAYFYILTQLYNRYSRLRMTLDPILDAPTIDRLKIIEMNRSELTEWVSGYAQFAYIDDPGQRIRLSGWLEFVRTLWQAMDTTSDPEGKAGFPDFPVYEVEKPAGPVPAKAAVDPRYPLVDLTKYKSAMFDPKSPTHGSVKHMVFINASEMSAAETMTYLYYGVLRMPMDFYYDVARHTWDEVRHSQMGVRRLLQMGYKTEEFAWHPCTVLSGDNFKGAFPEFYASLTMVMEPCSFIKKRKSIDSFLEHGDPMSSVQSEYDIADERLHVNFGKKWGAKMYEHIDDLVTAQSVERKAKQMHLQKMGYSAEEVNRVLDHFPEFCGFATMDLQYDKY
ncbi:MAG: hypothetical protein K0Q94_3199 [Paenibacillus sp.]|jgi:uncharacterized ferritin-like protein (DUF455 family)|uniref:DUF455 family protein n=1 Tax=Paenibacillus sp. GCM10012303 TaxID=3317340 RepID=UPI0029EA0767|nr:hypothetical protein [Paenibacillus sp.]